MHPELVLKRLTSNRRDLIIKTDVRVIVEIVLETDLTSNASRVGVLETDLTSNASRVGVLETDLTSNRRELVFKTDLTSNRRELVF